MLIGFVEDNDLLIEIICFEADFSSNLLYVHKILDFFLKEFLNSVMKPNSTWRQIKFGKYFKYWETNYLADMTIRLILEYELKMKIQNIHMKTSKLIGSQILMLLTLRSSRERGRARFLSSYFYGKVQTREDSDSMVWHSRCNLMLKGWPGYSWYM